MPRAFFVPETAEPQPLDEILRWHEGIVDALRDQRSTVLNAILAGVAVLPRFVGMTEGDVDDHYDAQRRELDRLTMLNLVASAEATVRVDYLRRVERKLKDPLSLAYREWHKKLSKKKKMLPDFDEGGILEVLKTTHVLDNNIVGQYRECLRARHWVGHGRYWAKPIEVDQLDPQNVYDRALSLLQALPPRAMGGRARHP
jgi:hypothetical protein